MMLGDLIEMLREVDPAVVVPLGFGNPHSYRGYYERLAFERRENATVGEMLAEAESALGKTFQGYKGGEYRMDTFSDVYLAEYGCVGEEIGPTFLRLLLSAGSTT